MFLLPFLACALDVEGDPVTLRWYTEEVGCGNGATYWTVPDPPPLVVQVLSIGPGYAGWWGAPVVADEHGVAAIACITGDSEQDGEVWVTYAFAAGASEEE